MKINLETLKINALRVSCIHKRISISRRVSAPEGHVEG